MSYDPLRRCAAFSAEHLAFCRREPHESGAHVGTDPEGVSQQWTGNDPINPPEPPDCASGWSQVLPRQGVDVELWWGQSRTQSITMRYEGALLSENGCHALLFSDNEGDGAQLLLVPWSQIVGIEWARDE